MAASAGMNAQQVDDPAKLATALIDLATSEQPPARSGAAARLARQRD